MGTFALVDYNRLTPLGTILLVLVIVAITAAIGWFVYARPRLKDYHRRNDEIAAAYEKFGLTRAFLYGREFGYGEYEGHRVIVTWMYAGNGVRLQPQFLVWVKTDKPMNDPMYKEGYLKMLYGKENVLMMLGGDETVYAQGEYQVKGVWTTDAAETLRTLLAQAIADVEKAQ